MTAADTSDLAIKLLGERSREALVAELEATLSTLDTAEMLEFVADLLLASGADRDHLKARVISLLASRFGTSSEKSSPEQLVLFAKALKVAHGTGDTSADSDSTRGEGDAKPDPAAIIDSTNAEIEAETQRQREEQKAAREARRAAEAATSAADGTSSVPWPTHLPVREDVMALPEALRSCHDCKGEMRIIRYESSWRLEYETVVEVVVTKVPVAACPSHHGGPVSPPTPPKPVHKGRMGFSLAARVLYLRVVQNLPVRRIAEMMLAEGAPVTEQMIHTLLCESGERAKPLAEAILSRVRQAALVNLDDTPTDVHEDHRRRKRRKARVWLALGDEIYAWFFATRTWKEAEAREKLGAISGVLQGDGYKGFPKYTREHGIDLAGCLAHLRRKLKKAADAKDPRAIRPFALVQGMYRVEKLASLKNLAPEQRLALRQERSKPLMDELLAWGDAVAPTIVTGSPLGQAWTYLSNQRAALGMFLTDGAVSIDNNAAERGLRRITIGRKLWLFFRGQEKLEHLTRLMSVMYTARLQEVDELAYLTWVLEELARREWSAESAARLLPEAWLAAQKQQAEKVGASEA